MPTTTLPPVTGRFPSSSARSRTPATDHAPRTSRRWPSAVPAAQRAARHVKAPAQLPPIQPPKPFQELIEQKLLPRDLLDLVIYIKGETGYSPTYEELDYAALVEWLKESLADATFGLRQSWTIDLAKFMRELRSTVEKVREGAEGPALDHKTRSTADRLVSLLEPANASSPPPEGLLDVQNLFVLISKMPKTELMTLAAEAVSVVEVVADVAEGIVSSIPLLGTLFSAIKLIQYPLDMRSLVNDLTQIQEYEATSFSAIETSAYKAIQYHMDWESHKLLAQTAGGVASVAASLAGVGLIASIGKSIAGLIARVVLQIYWALEVRALNYALQKRTLTPTLLDQTTLLRLHLPHLQGVDTLTLLGLTPPGWRNKSELREKIPAALNKIATLDQDSLEHLTLPPPGAVRVLLGSLQWEDAAVFRPSTASKPKAQYPSLPMPQDAAGSVWEREFKRARFVLEKSDKYLYPLSWRLYKGDQLVHDPLETGWVAGVKRKAFKGLKQALSSSAEQA